MSALVASVVTAEIALVGTTAKTVLMVTSPANHRLRIKEWSVSFDGISASAEPVVVEFMRFTTAGTFTSATPVKQDPSISETIQSTAGSNASAEPTGSDVLKRLEVHPQGGFVATYAPGEEPIVGGGGRIGVRCTAPANVNVVSDIKFEE